MIFFFFSAAPEAVTVVTFTAGINTELNLKKLTIKIFVFSAYHILINRLPILKANIPTGQFPLQHKTFFYENLFSLQTFSAFGIFLFGVLNKTLPQKGV